MYTNATVLITGGTGSFGRTMAARLLTSDCQEIRIFSRDEAKQDAMRREFSDSRLRFYIGDVRDPGSVLQATRGVDLVFHAAALKQVPSCEFFPMEAIRTNVMGTANVLDAAVAEKVSSVVSLGTDKAVYPINAMGMSKALMEKVVQAQARSLDSGLVLSTVRYGNVMYSRGSVIPLFVEQIESGGPITITEPQMTRFLLPLRVAVELVEFAFAHARPGDLFVRKAPACTIQLLAETMIGLFESSVEVQQIGIRHGEKVFETLATVEELRRSEDMGGYYRIPMDGRDLNYAQFFSEGAPLTEFDSDYTSHNAEQLDPSGVRDLLLELPEIRSDLKRVGVSRGE